MPAHVTLVDFEDSFTRNIAAEVEAQGNSCQMISHHDLALWARAREKNNKTPHVVILGPGPGHPLDYYSLFPVVRSFAHDTMLFVVGVCLGHQIWWAAHGAKVNRGEAIHGQAIPLYIPEWKDIFPSTSWGNRVEVQRYNSLAVTPMDNEGPNALGEAYVKGELMMSYGQRFLTYQFHPESVGTSCPNLFFRPIADFLYNKAHERTYRQNIQQNQAAN